MAVKAKAAAPAEPKAKAPARAATRKPKPAPTASAAAAAAAAAPARAAKAPAAAAKTATVAAKKLPPVQEAFTKSALIGALVEGSGVARRDVISVLDELANIIERHVKKRAVGTFTLPGLLKIVTLKKPAQKARKNVPNPFKPGETMDVAAKPATTMVRVRPLKGLKDMVQ